MRPPLPSLLQDNSHLCSRAASHEQASYPSHMREPSSSLSRPGRRVGRAGSGRARSLARMASARRARRVLPWGVPCSLMMDSDLSRGYLAAGGGRRMGEVGVVRNKQQDGWYGLIEPVANQSGLTEDNCDIRQHAKRLTAKLQSRSMEHGELGTPLLHCTAPSAFPSARAQRSASAQLLADWSALRQLATSAR
jgi:hypothetical protein